MAFKQAEVFKLGLAFDIFLMINNTLTRADVFKIIRLSNIILRPIGIVVFFQNKLVK